MGQILANISMLFAAACVAQIGALGQDIAPGGGQQQVKLSDAIKFCDTKVPLVEKSIKFDVKKLVDLDAASKPIASLDALSVVEISFMTLNCRLLVTNKITPEQFLTKQTEILMFALDVQSARELAQQKAKQPVSQKPPEGALQNIAKDLGIKLKSSTGAAQSGTANLINDIADRIVDRYTANL